MTCKTLTNCLIDFLFEFYFEKTKIFSGVRHHHHIKNSYSKCYRLTIFIPATNSPSKYLRKVVNERT